jgi:hypothetical protein
MSRISPDTTVHPVIRLRAYFVSSGRVTAGDLGPKAEERFLFYPTVPRLAFEREIQRTFLVDGE